MKRVTIALIALVLFAAACGSDSSSEDVLEELGLTPGEVACYNAGYDARGYDMDEMLASDPDDLSAEERQAVLDIAAECVGATGASAADETDDDTETAAEEPADTTTTAAPTTTTEAPATDDGERRGYDDLGLLEQAFVDGIVGSGGSVEVGVCMLDEFAEAGFSLLDIAEFGNSGDAEPPPEMMAAIFACGEELIESGLFDDPDFLNSSNEGDTYGDNADLDLLWDNCTAGDGAACDELYWTSAVGSGYEAYGNTCGDRFPTGVVSCETALAEDTPAGSAYGDDPTLDALWDSCAAGELTACDSLYFDSPFGSEYEAFGSTCGETAPESFGGCSNTDPFTYGDDADLDVLWDACGSGDLDACDELYIFSPFGSDYEAFGNTCGRTVEEDQFGNCAS